MNWKKKHKCNTFMIMTYRKGDSSEKEAMVTLKNQSMNKYGVRCVILKKGGVRKSCLAF